MKKILYMIWSLAAVCGAIGCSDDGDELRPEASDHYTATTVFFTADRGEQAISLNIQSSDYTVYTPTQDGWITYDKRAGELIVMVQPNTTDQVRESKIVVISNGIQETIPIVQDIVQPFVFKTDLLSVRGRGETKSYSFETTVVGPFKVEVDALNRSWLQGSIDEETGTLTLISSAQDIGAAQRYATVKISATSPLGIPAVFEFPVLQYGNSGQNYRFTLPDFSESKIYKVMADGKQIAEICKEWIGDTNAVADGVKVNMQAIVVYPMTAEGAVDLNQGYVANVIMANTGKNLYTYAAPTTPIHGGRVAWDKETNSVISYTDGTLETAPTEISIPGDSGIDHITLDDAVVCSVEPYVVNDNRPNDTPRTYSVVKVGTQYWLGENLKAKYFVDGTPIACGTADDWKNAQKPLVGATSLSGDIYLDLADVANADAIEAEIAKSGCVYNGNCINNISVTGNYEATHLGATAFWQATYSPGPLSADDDAISPEGWCVPTKEQTTALEKYVVDNTDYTGLNNVPESNPTRNTRLRRMMDVSNVQNDPENKTDHTLPWAMDENITGLATCPNCCLSSGKFYKDPLASRQNMLFLTRHLLHLTTGNSTNTTAAFVMWGNYQGGMNKNYFSVQYGVPIRCIRKY